LGPRPRRGQERGKRCQPDPPPPGSRGPDGGPTRDPLRPPGGMGTWRSFASEVTFPFSGRTGRVQLPPAPADKSWPGRGTPGEPFSELTGFSWTLGTNDDGAGQGAGGKKNGTGNQPVGSGDGTPGGVTPNRAEKGLVVGGRGDGPLPSDPKLGVPAGLVQGRKHSRLRRRHAPGRLRRLETAFFLGPNRSGRGKIRGKGGRSFPSKVTRPATVAPTRPPPAVAGQARSRLAQEGLSASEAGQGSWPQLGGSWRLLTSHGLGIGAGGESGGSSWFSGGRGRHAFRMTHLLSGPREMARQNRGWAGRDGGAGSFAGADGLPLLTPVVGPGGTGLIRGDPASATLAPPAGFAVAATAAEGSRPPINWRRPHHPGDVGGGRGSRSSAFFVPGGGWVGWGASGAAKKPVSDRVHPAGGDPGLWEGQPGEAGWFGGVGLCAGLGPRSFRLSPPVGGCSRRQIFWRFPIGMLGCRPFGGAWHGSWAYKGGSRWPAGHLRRGDAGPPRSISPYSHGKTGCVPNQGPPQNLGYRSFSPAVARRSPGRWRGGRFSRKLRAGVKKSWLFMRRRFHKSQ